MNRPRLLQTARVLRGVDPSRWHMDDWVGVDPAGVVSACPVGYSCLDPWFQDQGLALRAYDGGTNTHPALVDAAAVAAASTDPHRGAVYPSFDGHRGGDAVTAFWDLEPGIARYIFYPDRYDHGASPGDVLARILAFAAVDIVHAPAAAVLAEAA